MEALITGNIHLFLEVLRESSLRVQKSWKEAIGLFIASFEIITMEKHQFEEMAEKISKGNMEELSEDDPVAMFAGNLSALLSRYFGRKRKEHRDLGRDIETNAIGSFLDILQKPAIIANVVRVLMAMRFNLLNKSFMFKILMEMLETVASGTGWKRAGANLDSMFEKLIQAFFGNEIEKLWEIDSERLPM